jgi:hypothetical protein
MTNSFPTSITLTMPDGSLIIYSQNGIQPQPPQFAMDFTANLDAYPPGHIIQSAAEWNSIFQSGLDQGATIFCLEQSTGVTARQFSLGSDPQVGSYLELFMPKGSYGMEHRSCQVKIGKPLGPVNASFRFMIPDPGVNLFVNGGGKWGGAWQYGPIQSGSTGGIRMMGTWAAGASTLGKQDLTFSIQNQPNGNQWLQPPYYGYRPIEYNHWYSVHFRMTGATATEPTTVRCQYWKDQDPVLDYTANTDNSNAQAGKADVFWDITSFFGGTAPNCAPADAKFRIAQLRIWVE